MKDKGEQDEPQAQNEFNPPTSWMSLIFFSWMTPIIRNGFKKQLGVEDLTNLPSDHEVERLVEKFWTHMPSGKEAKATKYQVFRAIILTSLSHVVLSGIAMFLYSAALLVNPILLGELITSVQEDLFEGLYFAIGLFISGLVITFSSQLHFHYAFGAGRRTRALYMSLVFSHSLDLSVSQLSDANQGLLYTMVLTDSQRFYEIAQFMHLIWACPAQVAFVVFYLGFSLGVSSLAGISVLLLIIPFNVYMAHLKRRSRARHIPIADSRVRLCSEVTGAIQLVKLFSWETPYFEMIKSIRERQMKFVMRELYIFSAIISVMIATPFLATMGTFIALTLGEDQDLAASGTFSTVALFGLLKFPLINVSQLVMLSVQVMAAIDRLHRFLVTPGERASDDLLSMRNTTSTDVSFDLDDASSSKTSFEFLIKFQNATFSWKPPDKSDESFCLRDISIDIKPKELIGVIGAVGQGKSSFGYALLGELYCTEGTVVRNTDSIAYCSQNAFIVNGTVEENITFGSDYDEDRFRAVISACQMWPDLLQFQEGEKSMIGERGVSLSGGQKARIALARAVYSDKEILVLDDPFSALDSLVSYKVFESLFDKSEGLLRNKSVILVTHSTQNMMHCDKVILLFEGQVSYEGTFSELRERYLALKTQEGSDKLKVSLNALFAGIGGLDIESEAIDDELKEMEGNNIQSLYEKDFKSTKVMTVEDRARGAVLLRLLPQYIKASGGYSQMTYVLLFALVERVLYILSDFWLRYWSDGTSMFGLCSDGQNQCYSVGYAILVISTAIIGTFRTFLFVIGGGRAARVLFYEMLWRVMRSPMSFFDTVPHGRITNRLSFDTDVVDDILVLNMQGLVSSVFWLLSSIFVIIFVIPVAAAIVVPVSCCFIGLYCFYRKTCLELQRLDATTRSLVQAHFRETLEGLAIVHAFKQRSRFLWVNKLLVNDNHKAIYAFVSANCWFGVLMQLMSSFVVLVVSLSSWLLRNTTDPGAVGLAVLWSFNLAQSFTFFVRLGTQCEAKMTSLERIQHFTKLPQESDLQTTGPAPSKAWPTQGEIVFDDVTVRYRPGLPPALRNVSFRINPGEKIGVCGRTGSGKSTLANALFRLRDVETGSILIDGINLGKLGLSDVRGRACSIIMQDPLLFSGTVRTNLDPFRAFRDDEVVDALQKAQMWKRIELMGGIDALVTEGGNSFSQGERQLICLARLLIRKPKVVFLDEMSSSMDNLTDELVHSTIEAELSTSTVVEVAHRLLSIMTRSRIMVLNGGKLAEFDTPEALVQIPNGIFRGLIEGNGPVVENQLLSMIKKNV